MIKVLFMGTPGHSADILSLLIKERINICGVVTNPDKPKGRGLQNFPSPVALIAKENGLKLFKPEKANDVQFLKDISDLKADLAVVVAYGHILRKEFLTLPRYGCINLHTSLLPQYRGASPLQSALLNGDKITGATVLKISEKLDAGEIILQDKVSIDDADNSESLFKKLFICGGKLLIDTLELYNDLGNKKITSVPSIKQDETKVTLCRTIKKEDGKLNLNEPARSLHNKVRAFYSWPGAFAAINGKTVKILSTSFIAHDDISRPGEIVKINDEGIHVSTREGVLILKSLRPENSKTMDAGSFVRGYRLKVGDLFS